MKKIITAASLTLLLAVSAVCTVEAAQITVNYDVAADSTYCSSCADTDGDGYVTVADARNILRAAVGLTDVDDGDFGAYDVNADGTIGVDDARDSLRIAVGLDSRATHSKKEVVTLTQATCYQNGKGAFLCAHCGKIYGYTVLPNPGHVAGVRKLIKKATCTEQGAYEYRCKFCDLLIETAVVPTVEHEWTGGTVSCLEKINSTLICKNCGATKNIVINPVGHHDFRYVAVKEAKCTEDGERIQKCAACGYEDEKSRETIPARGHTPSGWIIEYAATSTKEGSRYKKCTVCGEKLQTETIPKK